MTCVIDYFKETGALAVFLIARARDLRAKGAIVNYLMRNVLRRFIPSLAMTSELFVRMKDVAFWFATGKSELSPYEEIFGDAIYERDSRFIARQGDTVIDIGAHIGFYALRQGLHMQGGKIYAFEPNPDTFRRLKRNIVANDLENVIVAENAAVAAEEGTVTLRISAGSSEGNTIMREGTVHEYGEKVEVSARTLDAIVRDYALKNIAILKIDAEGAEVEILRGGMQHALTLTEKIEIETHSPALREECENILESRGFEAVLRVPSGRNMLGENTLVYFVRCAKS